MRASASVSTEDLEDLRDPPRSLLSGVFYCRANIAGRRLVANKPDFRDVIYTLAHSPRVTRFYGLALVELRENHGSDDGLITLTGRAVLLVLCFVLTNR